jgi:hypothetical protein
MWNVDSYLLSQSSMNKKPILRRFNILNLQDGSSKIHFEIKELIYYAESRFLSILNNISQADENKKSWSQKLLHRELVISN